MLKTKCQTLGENVIFIQGILDTFPLKLEGEKNGRIPITIVNGGSGPC